MKERQEVVVTNIKVPFRSMVVLTIKWTLAAIPAMIIMILLACILGFDVFAVKTILNKIFSKPISSTKPISQRLAP